MVWANKVLLILPFQVVSRQTVYIVIT
jgi:hypothetical protein